MVSALSSLQVGAHLGDRSLGQDFLWPVSTGTRARIGFLPPCAIAHVEPVSEPPPPPPPPSPSLPPSADTAPTCTRADAHSSRAHITVQNSHIDPHFSNVGTPHWLKEKGICVAHFSEIIFISLSCLCWMSSWSLHSGHVFTNLLCVKTLSVLNLVW